MALVRLQKVLARAGIASRRAAERLIVEGRVRVGSCVVSELGSKVDPKRDRIAVDGRIIAAEDLVYVVLHKPRQVMCTLSDPEGRATIVDLLRRVPARVVPVGRLDYETSGVLLLSNDGEFTMGLAHPRHHAAKIYVAKVKGLVTEANLKRWRESIEIDGKLTRPAQVQILRHEGDKTWLEVTLHEGKNRQIHRLGEHAGFAVMRLARVSFAGITAEGLRPGDWRYLTVKELLALKRSHGVPKVVRDSPGSSESTERARFSPRDRSAGSGGRRENPGPRAAAAKGGRVRQRAGGRGAARP